MLTNIIYNPISNAQFPELYATRQPSKQLSKQPQRKRYFSKQLLNKQLAKRPYVNKRYDGRQNSIILTSIRIRNISENDNDCDDEEDEMMMYYRYIVYVLGFLTIYYLFTDN